MSWIAQGESAATPNPGRPTHVWRSSALSRADVCHTPRVQFEYSLTTKDYVAFNAHAARVSEPLKTQVGRMRALCTVIGPLAMFVAVGVLFHDWIGGAVAAVPAAIVIWFGYPRVNRWVTDRTLQRLAAHDGLGLTGTARLVIDDTGLHEELAGMTTSIGWNNVNRIDETAEHAFVFVTPVSGLIVPKREERSGELLAEMRARLTANRA
jgi:hypothetical protein